MANDSYTDYRRQPVAVGPDVAPQAAPMPLGLSPPPRKEPGNGAGSLGSAIVAGAAAGRAARPQTSRAVDAPLRVPRRPGLGGTPSQRIALDESVVGGAT